MTGSGMRYRKWPTCLLFVLATVAAYAEVECPQWAVNDWWRYSEVLELQLSVFGPGSSVTIHDDTEFRVAQIEERRQSRTGLSYPVYVLAQTGSCSLEGTIYLMNLAMHIRLLNGTVIGEVWNLVEDLSVAYNYRRYEGDVEVEGFQPGQWIPLGPFMIEQYEEFDLPTRVADFPFTVGHEWRHRNVVYQYGEYSLVAFGTTIADQYEYEVSWDTRFRVQDRRSNECMNGSSPYYGEADQLQDDILGKQHFSYIPHCKWFNRNRIFNYKSGLGLADRIEQCLTACSMGPEPTPIIPLELTLQLNRAEYRENDPFTLDLWCQNPNQETLLLDLYIVLDISSLGILEPYYFWPSWCHYPDQGVDFLAYSCPPDPDPLAILDFSWPEGAGVLPNIVFLALLMQHDEIASNLAATEFSAY